MKTGLVKCRLQSKGKIHTADFLSIYHHVFSIIVVLHGSHVELHGRNNENVSNNVLHVFALDRKKNLLFLPCNMAAVQNL